MFANLAIIAVQVVPMVLPALLATLPISDIQLTHPLYAFVKIDTTTLEHKSAVVAILPALNVHPAPLLAAQAATHSLFAVFREVAAYV